MKSASFATFLLALTGEAEGFTRPRAGHGEGIITTSSFKWLNSTSLTSMPSRINSPLSTPPSSLISTTSSLSHTPVSSVTLNTSSIDATPSTSYSTTSTEVELETTTSLGSGASSSLVTTPSTPITSSPSDSISQSSDASLSTSTESQSLATTSPIPETTSDTESTSSDRLTTSIPSSTQPILLTITDAPVTLETVINPDWTTNTWTTTTDDEGSETVVPVLVGCDECGDDDHSGILLWGLPPVAGILYTFSALPIPPFTLPCIQMLGMGTGQCPGPKLENKKDDDDTDDNESSTSSVSECTLTQTATDCQVHCSPTATSGTTSITCYTTVCSQTVTGCSVTGTTETTTTTPSCSATASAEAGSCGRSCPNWNWDELIEDTEFGEEFNLPPPTTTHDPEIFGRAEDVGFNKKIWKFGDCDLLAPESSPVGIPNYPGGKKFLEEGIKGFPNGDAERSSALPAWYISTTAGVAPDCTPTVIRVNAVEYDAKMREVEEKEKDEKIKKETLKMVPSMDHSWEKGWLTQFFTDVVLGSSGQDAMSCDDFNKYIFQDKQINLISDLYKSLPSNEFLEFIAMSQWLNGDSKGFIAQPDLKAKPYLTRAIDASVTKKKAKKIDVAFKNMDTKFGMLERARLGIYMINLKENRELAGRTNDRLYGEMLALDAKLQFIYSDVEMFKVEGGYFAPKFRKFIDSRVDGPDREEVRNLAIKLRDNLEPTMVELEARQEEFEPKHHETFLQYKSKIKFYLALPDEDWDPYLDLKWKCPKGLMRRQNGGSCELPPSQTSSTSEPSTVSTSIQTASSGPSTFSTVTQPASTLTTPTTTPEPTTTEAPTTSDVPTTSEVLTTTSEPPPPPPEPTENLECFGLDTRNYASRGMLEWLVREEFCPDAVSSGLDQDSASIVRTYNEGTLDEVTLSMDYEPSLGFSPDYDTCVYMMRDRIVDGCDTHSNDAKAGGRVSTSDIAVTYNVFPRAMRQPAHDSEKSDCRSSYRALYNEYNVWGSGWAESDWGESIKREIKGCALLPGTWDFNYGLGDDGREWSLWFRTGVFQKGCVGRAIRSAGAPNFNGCSGSG
ncbi:hypothetical protein HJFPF1_05884 [Paramyrothecium foliicola]|nr:hypothetical protein HJFPF1_05884 [Paramyrothecium foliicola]